MLLQAACTVTLPLQQRGYPLAANLAWQQLEVQAVQVLLWAYQGVEEEKLPLYVSFAWELLPLLQGRCSGAMLQGMRDRV